MIAKNWTRWTTLLLISTLTISGCSLIPNKKVEIVSKPLEIDIIQPTMPLLGAVSGQVLIGVSLPD